jgi:glucokinase
LEDYSSGPALVARFASCQSGFVGSAADVLRLAEEGHQEARAIVVSAGEALGSAIAGLVNMLDPAAVILGGGLGLSGGLYRNVLEATLRRFIWSDSHRNLDVRLAMLGNDAGWIGAALNAANVRSTSRA